MNVRQLIALTLALGLLLPTATAAAPLLTGPCMAGATYDPACDVDHDGDVDIFDIQKTAGHWNRSGSWVSDNDHDHLGQTWTGNNNRLLIQGAFGIPAVAPLVLTNSGAGDGLWVTGAGASGVTVSSAGTRGLNVISAGADGVYVGAAGNPTAAYVSENPNGFEVAGAEGTGVYVGRADQSGMFVYRAGFAGVAVSWADNYGLYVVNSGDDGLNVNGADLAGYFGGNIQVNGNCTGCLLATFGVNSGERPLEPGDLVSLAGLRASGVDSVPMLMEVQTAASGDAVVGVVQGWAELVTGEKPRPDEIGLRLVPREGPASPGQYVTIAYSGLMQVKVSGPIAQGSKLAVGTDGAARAVRTVNLDGVELAENASVIGVALESLGADDGLVWVLVNLQ